MTNEELVKTYFGNKHIVQSREWGEFKTLLGTRAVAIDNSQFTVHQLPFTPWKVGYAPKIRPEDLDLGKLYQAGRKGGCVFIKLDVPHAPKDFNLVPSAYHLVPGKSIFAKSTILMDLTKTDEELLDQMREKTRYNLKLAQKKGVMVKIYPEPETDSSSSSRPRLAEGSTGPLNEFVRLQKETAARQKFFVHRDRYYKTCFETLSPHGLAYLLRATVADQTAASWILFRHGDVLYYPYGESNYQYRPFMPSNLLMWEAIQLGKKLGCKVFDLWGAAEDPDDEKDPWHGFTRFKLSFGGLHLKLAPTYDLIITKPLYNLFNLANKIRWKILRKLS